MEGMLANHKLIRTVCSDVKHLTGDAVEFGVYRGDSLAVICDELAPVIVWGLDSFLGLPRPSACDENHEGLFNRTSPGHVVATMGHRTNYRIVAGWFKDTLPTLPVESIKFVHLDCDHYRSYREALAWLWPRLVVGGMVLSDDYGAPSCVGAKMAVDEWVQETPDCEACCPERAAHMILKKTEANHAH